MRRRDVITLLGGALPWPLVARAQQRERMRRIGMLLGYSANDPQVQARSAAIEGRKMSQWVLVVSKRFERSAL